MKKYLFLTPILIINLNLFPMEEINDTKEPSTTTQELKVIKLCTAEGMEFILPAEYITGCKLPIAKKLCLAVMPKIKISCRQLSNDKDKKNKLEIKNLTFKISRSSIKITKKNGSCINIDGDRPISMIQNKNTTISISADDDGGINISGDKIMICDRKTGECLTSKKTDCYSKLAKLDEDMFLSVSVNEWSDPYMTVKLWDLTLFNEFHRFIKYELPLKYLKLLYKLDNSKKGVKGTLRKIGILLKISFSENDQKTLEDLLATIKEKCGNNAMQATKTFIDSYCINS